MQEAKVWVPDERLPDFYTMVGQWLTGSASTSADVAPWADTEEDLVRARIVWEKLSPRGQALFGVLMDAPGERFGGLQLATDLDIPNGMYGVAGVLAWPGRHSAAVGRVIPVDYEDGPPGEGAYYWMEPPVAALFRKARDSE
jgi:hypothetical protein